jgi:hypothetical protein
LLLETGIDIAALVFPVEHQTMNCTASETEVEAATDILHSLPFIMNQIQFGLEKQTETLSSISIETSVRNKWMHKPIKRNTSIQSATNS